MGQAKVTCTWAVSPPLPLFCCPSPPLDLWSLPRPRFCLLSKEEGRGFGFHLQQELGRPGPVVCRVEPGTSAQSQGLREGDRILGVNDHVVECEGYAEVRLGWGTPCGMEGCSAAPQGKRSRVGPSLDIRGSTQALTSPTSQDLGLSRWEWLGEGM